MKNRKNRPVNGKVFRSGVYSTAILAAAILLAVLVNLVVRALPSKYTEFDLSEGKMYTLGDSSVQLAQSLQQDVTIYYLCETGSEDAIITKLLDHYAAESSHIHWEQKDPTLYPTFAAQYGAENASTGSLIVTSGEDSVVLDAAAPVIAGVDDGAVYCGSVTFTVTDAYLDTVTVDGTAAVSAPGRAAGSTYIIEADSQLHTIVATDRAGNSTQVQITVNNGHTVGTPASCKAPAVCRYCGESFGDPAPGNHGGLLRRVDKVNATSTADGNIEYWYCSGCGKYYLDAAAGREITRGDTILPAIGLRIVGDVRVWRPGDKTLDVTFRQEYDDFTVQIDGVTVDPANYEVTADPDGGRLIVTFRAQFLRTLAFGERTITIVSDDGSASVSFRRDSARAVTSGGKAGVTSAATGDGFPMGGMAAALLVSGSALVMLTTRARRKEEE